MGRNFKELYRYRALLWALVSRHLAVRYRGSVLGFLWSFLNPLCLMLVYVLVFRYYIRFNQVENYTLFLFCGLLPWLWISSGLLEGTASIVSSGHLITKSMFPAHLLPTVSVITTMIHFILALPLLFLFVWLSGSAFHLTLLLLPVLVLGQFCLLWGLALGLGAINVRYRDVQHIVGNLLTFLFFLCPIVYPASVVPEKFRFTLDLNPLALLTQFYQQIVFEGIFPSFQLIIYFSALVGLVVLLGHMIFNATRESFAELL